MTAERLSTAYDIDAHTDADVFDPIAWFEGTGEDLGLPPGFLERYNAVYAQALADEEAKRKAKGGDLVQSKSALADFDPHELLTLRGLLTKEYNPDEPRDERGRWEGGSGTIDSIVSVTDTRVLDDSQDPPVRIPGSGSQHECDRCGSTHEIHVTARLTDGRLVNIGSSCARRDEMQMVRPALNAAKNIDRYQGALTRAQTQIDVVERERTRVMGLSLPPVVETDRTTDRMEGHRVFTMGDAKVWQRDDGPITGERLLSLEGIWRDKRIQEATGLSSSQIYGLYQDRDRAQAGLDRAQAAYAQATGVKKSNPYHDELGRFASADSAAGATDRAPISEAFYPIWRSVYGHGIDTYAEQHGMTPAAYEKAATAKIQEALGRASIRVGTDADFIPQIVADGRLKNQFETGHSRGLFDPRLRAGHEMSHFGLPMAGTPPETRPVYGYLREDDFGATKFSGVRGYGNTTLELKDSVRSRTTLTWGDSFSATCATRLTSAGIEGYPLPQSDPLALKSIDDLAGRVPYVEAQIHGGVRLSDIASVTFEPEGAYFGQTFPNPAATAALDAAGIPWKVRA